MKIAVLDDNQCIGEMLQYYLGLKGHTVVVYCSPSKFLVNIIEPPTASTPLDLLVVDLFLSEGISGVEVIRQVWNAFPDLPVILISAGGFWQIETARRAVSGVRVLQKPLNIATLLAMVKELAT